MKNKEIIYRIFVGVLAALCFSCSPKQEGQVPSSMPTIQASRQKKAAVLPFKKGEKIVYEIKNFGIKAGDATLTFKGEVQVNNQKAFLIVFKANGMNFYDEERIYADEKTFYPVFVQRNLNIWGQKEKIDEYYEPDQGQVRVVKIKSDGNEEQVIKKPGHIDNIYCFIYRCRRDGVFNVGDTFHIPLPTTDVTIELDKKTTLKTAGQTFDAYYMKSQPSKYQVWFDTSKKHIPLRINGSVGISATTMTMVDYHEEETNK